MYRSKLIWSVVGLAAPLLSAAIFIPILLGRIGQERFGIISLSWVLLSAASALDLGIGRATTQLVAALRGRDAPHLVPATVKVAWELSITYSGIGAALFLLATFFDVQNLIRHQEVGPLELKYATLVIIAILPVQVLSALYRGICEAFEDFKIPSLVRLLMGALNFAGPVVVSFYTHSLVALAASLLVARTVGMAILYYGALRHTRQLRAGRHQGRPLRISANDRRRIRRKLNHFGKWMTISNIAHPLLMQSDRFIIASTISAAAVTVYYVPLEIVIQCTMIASAVTSVMFPMLTARLQHSQAEAWKIFVLWRNRLLVASAVLFALLAVALPTILHYWMGDKVGPESATLGQILCLGAFFYTISVVYTSYLHAQGRVSACALLQLVELGLYIPALYFVTRHFGLYGAAITWVGRSILDAVALAIIAGRGGQTPRPTRTARSRAGAAAAAAAA